MKLILVRQMDMDPPWYTIENVDHADFECSIPTTENSCVFWRARRICDADVEGSADEMRELAKAIRKRSNCCFFKRCAVEFGNGVSFFSPRNSHMKSINTEEEADALADQIEQELG